MNTDYRLKLITEGMIQSGCRSAHIENAPQILHILDETGANPGDPLIFVGGVQTVVEAANQIRKSNYSVIYLIACDIEISDGLMATYKHYYEFIRNIYTPLIPDSRGVDI
jgi:hypothetical protein